MLSPSLGTLELAGSAAAESITGPAAGVTISGDDAVRVFQVDNGVTASLSGLTITGGSTTGNGGGLYDDGGTLTLSGVTVTGNTAAIGGGLFLAAGPSTAADEGEVGITERTTTTVINCTVSGNTATTGGGVYNAGTAYLTACTIAINTAAEGGGIDNAAGASATLEDTIIAANLEPGGSASDIGGDNASGATGTYDLVGTGGSGGLAGSEGNMILTDLASLDLAPLGNYGGPTPTMPLLPGSAALGNGTVIAGVTTDQRGEPLAASVDIGAFQSQGFILTAVAGSTPQATIIDTAFASPLAITVTAINPIEPVAGGIVSFTVNPAQNGASASLSTATAIIGSGGIAQVTATANTVAGPYTATASSTGATSPVSFSLDNLIALAFSGVVSQSIRFGTSSATVSGTLADGTQAPSGENVAVTLDGVTRQAVIGSSGTFSTTFSFDGSGPNVSDSPYTVTYSFTSDRIFASATTSSSVTITPATLAVTADAEQKFYATDDPALQFTARGFAFSDNAATVLSGALARAEAGTLAGEQAGPYAITQGTLAADSNYAIAFTGSTLMITPAVLAVTANPQTKVYGTDDPSLTDGVTGLVNTTVDGVAIDDSGASVLTGSLTRAGGHAGRRAGRPLCDHPGDAGGRQQLRDYLHWEHPDNHAGGARRHGQSADQGLRHGRSELDLRRDRPGRYHGGRRGHRRQRCIRPDRQPDAAPGRARWPGSRPAAMRSPRGRWPPTAITPLPSLGTS